MLKPSCTTAGLTIVIGIQWILFTALLQQKHVIKSSSPNSTYTATAAATFATLLQDTKRSMRNDDGSSVVVEQRLNNMASKIEVHRHAQARSVGGVAATVMFRAPKWFHVRYKVMLDNALVNLPDETWKIQVFINEPWVKNEILQWHPGLARLLSGDHPRVIVTPLPTNLTRGKPKEVMLSQWFWNAVAADKVILFSGNGAFCGNQPVTAWEGLLDLDFCGAPWTDHDGAGGDGGSHSFRSRPAMLETLKYAEKYGHKVREQRHFLDTMMVMNAEKPGRFKIATPEQTVVFGGVYNLSDPSSGLIHLPLTVAGTQAKLTWEQRDSLLKHCPELKVIFPSLHEPACFGAQPDWQKCKATICALQDNVPAHGC